MSKSMRVLTNIEKSSGTDTLWPPVADAVGTFVRRRACGADGYELTWRLIHVWEAIAIVLSGACTARLRSLPAQEDAFRRCREHHHGRSWDTLSRTFLRSDGILDGSANRRIDLLWELDTVVTSSSRFLDAARAFLKTSGLDLRPLVWSWKQICDVPDGVSLSDAFTVREAFRHVNSFRNRLAHVPFPYDEMAQLAEGLSDVTEQLFTLDPKPWQTFPDARLESPLNGAIEHRGRLLRGKQEPQLCDNDSVEPCFVFPSLPSKPMEHSERWDGRPFLHVDSMFRPSVLSRLVSESSGVWEYTRFLAERNSITRSERPELMELLRQPTASEYPVPLEEEVHEEAASPPAEEEAGLGSMSPPLETDFDRALRNIANEEYEKAILYFEALVARNPNYHIGWLRLGHAQRELAMRRRTVAPADALRLFCLSIDSLSNASFHSHPPRRAQALYERSKAYYHRGRLGGSAGTTSDTELAWADATAAYAISPDTKHETWIAYLERQGARPEQQLGATQAACGSSDASSSAAALRAEELYRQCLDLFRKGDYTTAAKSAEEALQLRRDHAPAWRILAICRSQLGQHDASRAAWLVHDHETNGPISHSAETNVALQQVRENWSSPDAW